MVHCTFHQHKSETSKFCGPQKEVGLFKHMSTGPDIYSSDTSPEGCFIARRRIKERQFLYFKMGMMTDCRHKPKRERETVCVCVCARLRSNSEIQSSHKCKCTFCVCFILNSSLCRPQKEDKTVIIPAWGYVFIFVFSCDDTLRSTGFVRIGGPMLLNVLP
jgi:hypothetical protein